MVVYINPYLYSWPTMYGKETRDGLSRSTYIERAHGYA